MAWFWAKKIGYLLDAPNLAPQDIEYFYKSQNKTDFIIVPSEFAQLIFSSIFNINAQRIIPSGFCRDEYILNSNGKANLQKLTTHNIYSYNKIFSIFLHLEMEIIEVILKIYFLLTY